MEAPKDGDRESLQAARIVHADVLDETSLVLSFSNGAAARLDLEEVKLFALAAAKEIIPDEEGKGDFEEA